MFPTHFPQRFEQTSGTSLLWLSDLHFSGPTTAGDRRFHAFPDEAQAAAAPLRERLASALSDVNAGPLGGLIVSGDLAWRADPREFEQARELIAHLAAKEGLDAFQVAVCPGNHDVAYSEEPWVKGSAVTRAPEVARAAYAEFYTKFFSLRPNEHMSCGRRYLLGGAVPVEAVCLNSSYLGQQDGLFQGHGFVGQPQLDDAAREMGWKENPDGPLPVRILVIHHHVLPVTYRDTPVAGWTYSVALDAEAVLRWAIEHRIQVILHGHMHAPFYSAVERPIRFGEPGMHRVHVFGMGSTGVVGGHLGEGGQNLFALLRFSRDELEVVYYSVHPTLKPAGAGRHTVRLWE